MPLDLNWGEIILFLPIWYLIFLLSLTAHEMAHAWMALRLGDPTAYEGGQVSLDPRPHVQREKWGMVIVPLATYFLNQGTWMMGWASAPYNPYWADRYPKRAAWMSLSGPAVNLVLALVGLIVLKVMLVTGLLEVSSHFAFYPLAGAESGFASPSGNAFMTMLGAAAKILLVLNLVLFIFNLIPVPPLDGSSIVGLFLTHEQRLQWRRLAQSYWFIGLLVAWRIIPYVVVPCWRVVLWILGPFTVPFTV